MNMTTSLNQLELLTIALMTDDELCAALPATSDKILALVRDFAAFDERVFELARERAKKAELLREMGRRAADALRAQAERSHLSIVR